MMGAKCNNSSPLEAGFSPQLTSCRQSVRWDEEIYVVGLGAENICAVFFLNSYTIVFTNETCWCFLVLSYIY